MVTPADDHVLKNTSLSLEDEGVCCLSQLTQLFSMNNKAWDFAEESSNRYGYTFTRYYLQKVPPPLGGTGW